MLGFTEALLYGLVQGIAEYLPISSSAHLLLMPLFLDEKDLGLAFDVFLHFGTLLATVSFFWKDWWGILKNLKTPERAEIKASWIVIATIPALIAGALLHSIISGALRGPQTVVITLFFGGVVLYLADRFSKGEKKITEMTNGSALWFGVFQCFALIPGVSRSGSTLTAGRVLGFTREASARFSFLISAPITLAAVVFESRKFGELLKSFQDSQGMILLAGFFSFLFGFLTIKFLLQFIKKYSFFIFCLYRVMLAGVVYVAFVRGA